jgi:nucleoside-diphosphate-sugar epimerase
VTDPQAYREYYRDRRVMITGGLGFIGSNLARQLVDLGADVLIVDSLLREYGGNLFNIERIDIGSFYSDSTKFQRAVGWEPRVDLREGLRRTLAFYREHLPHYVEAPR